MLHPSRTVIVIIGVFFAGISQAIADGCTIEIKLPLAVKGMSPQNFTTKLQIGRMLKFNCYSQDHITYSLIGAPKVICQKDSTWTSKIPRCKATLCSPTPPTVPNAQVVTTVSPGQSNKIGATMEYKCVKGYAGQYFSKVCQKDGYWQGNVSCKKISCVAPVLQNGNVSYTSLDYGGSAKYSCSYGYILSGPNYRTCGDNGLWSGNVVPHCYKLCRQLINPKNGNFRPAYSTYRPGVVVKLHCTSRYVVKGSTSRTCQNNGEWNGIPNKCVINSCGPPGPFPNGRIIMAQDRPYYRIGTTVKFDCFTGYKLKGSPSRQCLSTGRWSEVKNPTCVEVYCSEPGHILHGDHNYKIQGKYPYGTKLVYTCNPHYYIWSKSDTLECKAFNLTPYWSSSPPSCLSLSLFSTKCHNANGHFHIENGHPHCILQATSPTTAISESSANRHSMDTLTIVTASAGSTLGVLVIILSIMVFVRRFHRNRRFRNHAIRSRFYSDDDHVTLIACPRGFHFPLPSYDEAMSQVQRDPPPFHSLVLVNGTTTINNNSNTTPSDSDRADPDAHYRTVLQVSADQQINIVSNPLTESQQRNESESNPGANPGENSNRNSICSQDSLVISEPPSSHDGTTLSLSEDEQSVNESQPLIG